METSGQNYQFPLGRGKEVILATSAHGLSQSFISCHTTEEKGNQS